MLPAFPSRNFPATDYYLLAIKTLWQSDSAVQELSERNKNLEGVIYPGAGHLFSTDIDQEYGRIWPTMLGGTVDGNRAAKIQSDKLLFERLDAWHMDT